MADLPDELEALSVPATLFYAGNQMYRRLELGLSQMTDEINALQERQAEIQETLKQLRLGLEEVRTLISVDEIEVLISLLTKNNESE